MNNDVSKELFNKLGQELRRGVLVIAALSLLEKPKYGYELLKDMNDSNFTITQDTLYPLLRRLEEQGLLKSEWILEGSRPRKYYSTSEDGERMYLKLKQYWLEQNSTMEGIIR